MTPGNPLVCPQPEETIALVRAVLHFVGAVQPLPGVELSPDCAFWHGLTAVLVTCGEALETAQAQLQTHPKENFDA